MSYYNYYPYGAVPDALNQMKVQYVPPMMNGGLLWVDSEDQAKNYMVAPNNVVPMFDKNKAMLYVKGADGAGQPNFKRYSLVECDETSGQEYATKDDIKALEAKFDDILSKLKEE